MAGEDASERLLPLPTYHCKDKKSPEGGWTVTNTAFVVSLMLNLVLVITICGLSWMKPAAPQWNDAVQAAELAATKWCSGNGNVFADTMGVADDGSAACECNDCFTGPDCSISVPDCIADADAYVLLIQMSTFTFPHQRENLSQFSCFNF